MTKIYFKRILLVNNILIIIILDNQSLTATINRYEKDPSTRVESSVFIIG